MFLSFMMCALIVCALLRSVIPFKNINNNSLSLSFSFSLSLASSLSLSLSLSLSFSTSLSLTSEEGVRTLFTGQERDGGREREIGRKRVRERELHACCRCALSVPHSVSQSACVIIILIIWKVGQSHF